MNMKIEYDERTEEILAEVVRDALQSDADNMRSLNNQESSASSKQIRQSVKKVNKKCLLILQLNQYLLKM